MSRNKVLFIAYHFPPDSAVGGIRAAKFVKYLSSMGWQLRVLALKEDQIPLTDYGRVKEVAHVPVIRTAQWPTIPEIALRIRKRALSLLGLKKEKAGPSEPGPENSITPGGSSIINTLVRFLNSILEMPDREIGWLLPAVWRGYWLIKREDISVIITSSPPRTVALAGLFLSWLTGKPLLTDLRDPWFTPYGSHFDKQSWLSDRIQLWLEMKIIYRSKYVITTTDRYTHFLRTFYSKIADHRVHTITNGYDDEDFQPLQSIRPGRIFTFSYLGSFYWNRTPKDFLAALAAFMKENNIAKSEIEVNFIGDVHSAEDESVEEMIKSHNLTDCVKLRGPVPYKESLIQMKISHVLLLFAPNQYLNIPGKAFEYIASRRRVLCISNAGATADLFKKTGAGIVVRERDVQAMKEAIQELYFEYKREQKDSIKIDLSTFDRKTLTKELSDLIGQCIS
jgi:glycosyltransferase involved in cell wall biosynthesis